MWYNTLKTSLKLAVITIITGLLTACGDGSPSQDLPAALQPIATETTISGSAAKGALINAVIKVYNLDEGGNISDPNPVFETTTNDLGEFTLTIPPSDTPRLIKSFGGSYIDEADQEPDITLKRRINFTPEQGLTSVLLPNQTSVAITIASTALIAKTKAESTSNNFLQTLTLNQTNAATAFGFNIIDTVPADTLSPSDTATTTQMQYALVLGGLANLVNRYALELGFGEPNFSIIEAIIHDLSDGIVDGQYQGVPLEFENKYGEQQALPQDISLNEQINRFKNNNSENFSQTPSITVNELILQQPQITNLSPLVSVSQPLEVEGLKTASITASASDPDGQVESINWTQTSGPELELQDTHTETLTLTAPDVLTNSKAFLLVNAIDDQGAVSSATVEVIIIARNRAPIITLPESFEINEQTQASIAATITDSDGSVSEIQWQQTAGPKVELVGSNSATIRFTTPEVTTKTPISFEVTATDDDADSASKNITITIIPLNIPPNVSAGSPQIIYSEKIATLTGEASDSDGSISSSVWSQISGPAASITSPSSLNTQIIAPKVSVISDLTFNLHVTDNEGATSSADVSVIVKPIIAPTVFAGEDQIVESNSLVNLQGAASDSDGEIVSIIWAQTTGTVVSLANKNSLTTHFTAPTVTTKVQLSFSLTVTDNTGASTSDSLIITVEPPNLPPQVDAGENQVTHSGLPVILSGQATDSDGTITAYLWAQTAGPSVALSSPTEASTSFTAPIVSTNQVLSFTLAATDDDGATHSASVDITVEPSNLPPQVDAGENQITHSGLPVILSGQATDSDGTITAYLWAQTAGPSVALSSPTEASTSFTAPIVSTNQVLSFTLTATDDDGATHSASVDITVEPPNKAPDIALTSFQTVNASQSVSLSATVTDTDGTISSYLWQQTSGTTVALSGANTANASFIAPNVSQDTTFTFTLSVTDDDGLTASANTTVLVVAINTPPTVNAGPDQSIHGGRVISLAGSASDNGSINAYEWSQISGNITVSFSSPTSAITTINSPIVQSNEILVLQLKATDDQGLIGTDTVTVTIMPPNLNPTASAGLDTTAIGNQIITLNGTASDSDGTISSYLWTQAAGTSATISNINASSTQVTIPANSSGEVLTFKLTATDDDGAIAQSSVDVIVYAPVLAWQFNSSQAIHSSPAIDSNGNIIFGNDGNKIYSIAPAGTENWRYTAGGAVKSSVMIDNTDNIYVGAGDGAVYKLSSSGANLWTFATSDPVINPVTLASNSEVYVSSGNNTYVLLADESGTPDQIGDVSFSDTLSAGLTGLPGVVNENAQLIYPASTAVINQIELSSTPVITSTFMSPSAPVASGISLLGTDSAGYFIDSNDLVTYFENVDGIVVQTVQIPLADSSVTPIVIGYDNDIYFGTQNGYFYRYTLNNAGSSLNWQSNITSLISSSAILLTDGEVINSVIFGAEDGYVYSLNPNDGALQWKFKTAAAIKTAPVFYNNTLYVTSTDGKLYAILLTGQSLSTSPWPMYQRDPKHQANMDNSLQAGMN